MDSLQPVNVTEGKVAPTFQKPIQKEWYNENSNKQADFAKAMDMGLFVTRQNASTKMSWTFNEAQSKRKSQR
jgi:hypothetical protein